MRPAVRRLVIVAAVLGVLCLLAFAAYRAALQRLHDGILDALGPRATVGALELGLAGVELRDLRVRGESKGPRKWPAADELRAERVTLRPDFRAVFSGNWRIGEVQVERPYVSLLRGRDGKLQVLPSLTKPAADQRPGPAAAPLVLIDRIRLHDAEVELFDASVRRPAHRVRLTKVQVSVDDLKLPALDSPVALRIEGVFKGTQRDGRLAIEGQVTPATRDADLRAQFRDVDLVALQPYLLKNADGAVRRGGLDLRLHAVVKSNRLNAPGTLTLREVELASNSVTDLPRRALLAAMDREGRITVDFTLSGRLDDPNFSLNEDLATQVAVGLAEKLGMSLGGVTEGLGSVVKGLLGR